MTFVSGTSGNEKGRPPGIVDKRTRFRQLLEPYAHEIIEKVVEMALAGDISAIKICMDRLVPRIKSEIEDEADDSVKETIERLRDTRMKYREY